MWDCLEKLNKEFIEDIKKYCDMEFLEAINNPYNIKVNYDD